MKKKQKDKGRVVPPLPEIADSAALKYAASLLCAGYCYLYGTGWAVVARNCA